MLRSCNRASVARCESSGDGRAAGFHRAWTISGGGPSDREIVVGRVIVLESLVVGDCLSIAFVTHLLSGTKC